MHDSIIGQSQPVLSHNIIPCFAPRVETPHVSIHAHKFIDEKYNWEGLHRLPSLKTLCVAFVQIRAISVDGENDGKSESDVSLGSYDEVESIDEDQKQQWPCSLVKDLVSGMIKAVLERIDIRVECWPTLQQGLDTDNVLNNAWIDLRNEYPLVDVPYPQKRITLTALRSEPIHEMLEAFHHRRGRTYAQLHH